MAQAMTLTCTFCGLARASTPFNKQPPHLFFSPLPPRFSSTSSSSSFTAFALFKSKIKAPPSRKLEKPKPKVEDGIFGTSGGIGFTKQNELFVGRVAMIGFAVALSLVLGSAAHGEEDGIRRSGSALFNRSCIGCHDGGGNVIQPGATLFAGDLARNGEATEEEIFRITYAGKGRMPGFGEECTPRGQCTFGPRLMDDEIRLLAQFVKLQAQQGWPKIY